MSENNWGMIGHEWAVNLLAARVKSHHTSHAYLFTGPPGVGKTTLALRFAQALNCTGITPPCGVCRACELAGRRIHPDVQVVEADGVSIKIEQIRNLQNDLSLQPFEARYRVAIILRMQDATDSAADSLLKTLEEPPPTVRLILTADVAENLFPTVVSRCQVIPLRPVPAARIEEALVERFGVSLGEAAMLAHLSGGRPGWALTAAQDPGVLIWRDEALDGLLGAVHSDRTGRFAYAEAIATHDQLDLILDIWQAWWRDVLLLAEGSGVHLVNHDRRSDLEKLAYRAGAQGARRALRAVCETIDALGKNANKRLALEVMLLEVPYI